MYTKHEDQIRVMYISYEAGEEEAIAQRIKRLHRFAEHLGFLVSALLRDDTNIIVLYIEPHVCPCDHIPYREKIRVMDTVAIDGFCRNSGLVVSEVVSLEESERRETKAMLDDIETDVNKLN